MKKSIYLFLLVVAFACEKEPVNSKSDLPDNSVPDSAASMYFTYDYAGFTPDEVEEYTKFVVNNSWAWYDQGNNLNRFAHLHIDLSSPHFTINRRGEVHQFEEAPDPEVSNFVTTTSLGQYSLKDYVGMDEVDGMIILHHGKVVFEAYPRMFLDDHHIYFSVSKTFVATAVAVLEDRNQVDVQKYLSDYLVELKGSLWDSVTVLNALNMSSGIDCEAVYDRPGCYLTMQGNYADSNDPLADFATLDGRISPGERFEYNDLNTMMLIMLFERLSGTSIADFIENEIWSKTGATGNGMVMKTSKNRSMAHMGISSTLRDLARYGYLFTPSGRNTADPIISDRYLQNIQVNYNPKLKTKSWFSDEMKYNSYQWDEVYEDGDFYKHGHAGQGLYISTTHDLVIAFFGTCHGIPDEHELPAICRQLVHSGIFD